jgi:hypothetical protein
MSYMGTLVTGRTSHGVVIATALDSELGQIQAMLGGGESTGYTAATPAQPDRLPARLSQRSGLCWSLFDRFGARPELATDFGAAVDKFNRDAFPINALAQQQ